jgi:hypothetical protein
VPGDVVCFGQLEELAGRLLIDGHGVVVGVLLEQGLQRRCDVGAMFDQALLAGVGLADFALGAGAAEEPFLALRIHAASWLGGVPA